MHLCVELRGSCLTYREPNGNLVDRSEVTLILTWVLVLTRLGSSVKDPPRQMTVSFPLLHMQEHDWGQEGAAGGARLTRNNIINPEKKNTVICNKPCNMK